MVHTKTPQLFLMTPESILMTLESIVMMDRLIRKMFD